MSITLSLAQRAGDHTRTIEAMLKVHMAQCLLPHTEFSVSKSAWCSNCVCCECAELRVLGSTPAASRLGRVLGMNLRHVVDSLADFQHVLDDEHGHLLLVVVPDDAPEDEHRDVGDEDVGDVAEVRQPTQPDFAADQQRQQQGRRQDEVDARDRHDGSVQRVRQKHERIVDVKNVQKLNGIDQIECNRTAQGLHEILTQEYMYLHTYVQKQFSRAECLRSVMKHISIEDSKSNDLLGQGCNVHSNLSGMNCNKSIPAFFKGKI
jgi:hypothetical protein